jgi:protein O-mannosyl-transferase
MQRLPPAHSRHGKATTPALPQAARDRSVTPGESAEVARSSWLAAGALFAIAVTVFTPALNSDFVNLDDTTYVVQNKSVKAGLSTQGFVWAFTTFESANWHPLTWLSLELDASLWRLRPLGFHLTNILLHAANAALLFLALRALTGCYWRSIVVALLFAVHPLRVESVAWVSERKDVLSAFFGLLTLWAYAVYARRPSASGYLSITIPFILSLLAKPMFVTLPCLLLVLDWWPLGRANSASNWWRLVLEKVPLATISTLSSAITFRAQTAGGAVIGLAGFSTAVRLENAVLSYAIYLNKTFLPVELSAFYPHPAYNYDGSGGLVPATVASALILLTAISVAAFVLRRRAPYLLAGWLWYLGTLVPVIGLVQVGLQGHADRYTYFPQVGIFVALCWGVADLARGWPRATIAAASGAAVALAGVTVGQMQIWQNSDALWNHAHQVVGRCPTVLVNLGECLERKGERARAFAYYQDALQMDPHSSQIRLDLGNAFQSQGKWNEAAEQFREACRLAPQSPGGYSNLGNILLRQGNVREAREQFEIACQLAPDLGEVFLNLALADYQLGNYDQSAVSYRKALELKPDYVRARIGLGAALVRSGNPKEGLALLSDVVRNDPDSVEGHYRLAEALENQHDLDGAAEHFQHAIQINEKAASAPGGLDQIRAPQIYQEMAAAWQALGQVHVRQGRDAEGVDCLLRALAINASLMRAVRQGLTDAGRSELIGQIEERLRNAEPARNPPGRGSAH